MSEMGSHDLFEHLKHKLWSKERSESNWQFDSPPQKVGNDLISLLAGGVQHTVGKL
jgi:hypothetical protein